MSYFIPIPKSFAMMSRFHIALYSSRIGFPDKACFRYVSWQGAARSNSQPIARSCNIAMERIGCAIYRVNLFAMGLLLMLSLSPAMADSRDQYYGARQSMVGEVETEVRATALHLDGEKLEPRVLAALKNTLRHEFVPEKERKRAYQNRPLPIGHGQTISQPFVVAIMTDLLNIKAEDRVLEVGTGSGYQAAILASLASKVFSIEIIKPLGTAAKERLNRLGYENIEVRLGDGYYGWEEHAPFDAIIVTAAASHIPPPLIEQLKPGGRMVAPVGSRFLVQELLLVEKDAEGELHTRQILPVRFVPLTGSH